MKVSTFSRYALRAMVDIAEQGAGVVVSAREISERQDISAKYLEQILRMLKRNGLVQSTSRPNGGYVLKKAPSKITALDIIRAAESCIEPVPCIYEDCKRKTICRTKSFWYGLDLSTKAYLAGWTLDRFIGKKKQ